MTFSTILGVTEILCSFRLVLEWKTGKEMPRLDHQESSRLEFFDEFSANSFALSGAEDTSELLNRGGIEEEYLCREHY